MILEGSLERPGLSVLAFHMLPRQYLPGCDESLSPCGSMAVSGKVLFMSKAGIDGTGQSGLPFLPLDAFQFFPDLEFSV